MKLKKILPAIALVSMSEIPFAMTSLTGCSKLHIHTFTSDYEFDETHHWKTCKICHEKFDVNEHIMNPLTNKCMVCGYEDPLVYVDADDTMTGMTEYGKTKLTFDVPHNVKAIANGAFLGSKAMTVNVNKECEKYEEYAFVKGPDSKVKIITYEVEDPQLEYKNHWVFIKNYFDDSEARVGNTYYATLKEAIESTPIGDITVTLLRENIEETDPEPIKVTHAVTLVPYHSTCNLKCNFDIGGAGAVYIPETVHYYDSEVKLLLSDFIEYRGKDADPKHENTEDSVYNTGSLVFTHRKVAPYISDNIKVTYVKSFGSGSVGWPAVGSYQVANTLLVLPVDNYAYGTFRFSKDFKTIRGLTEYGQTVSELHITNVVEGINAIIGQNAFTLAWRFKFHIAKGFEDVWLNCFRSKGWFFDLCVDDGITSIGKYAFSCRFTTSKIELKNELMHWLSIVFSHLFSVKIGDSVTEIGDHAFRSNTSLETVSGGKNLKTIKGAAFYNCFNLVSADFSKSEALNKIGANAFAYDTDLIQVILPTGMWNTGGDTTYFPYNFSPERFAAGLKHSSDDDTEWTKTNGPIKPVWYTKSTKTDEHGWFSDVGYADKIDDALKNCVNGGEIYLSDTFKGSYEFNLSDIKKFTSGITLNADKSLSNITISPNMTNYLQLPASSYLVLSNVKPSDSVTNIFLCANNDSTVPNTFKDCAGLAIEGLDPAVVEDIKSKIYINNGQSEKPQAKVNTASIRDTSYDAFGLFDFTLGKVGSQPTTTINDISKLGRESTSVTFDSQIIEDVPSDIYIDHNDGQHLTGSSNIVNVTLSDRVKSISNNFFYHFNKLRQFTAGEGLESIGTTAFDEDSSLREVYLNAQLKTIGESAFHGCESLWTVNFPDDNNLQQIGKKAFEGCANLLSFHFGNNNKNWKAGDTSLDPDDLADDLIAAIYLTRDTKDEDIGYMSQLWTRAI